MLRRLSLHSPTAWHELVVHLREANQLQAFAAWAGRRRLCRLSLQVSFYQPRLGAHLLALMAGLHAGPACSLRSLQLQVSGRATAGGGVSFLLGEELASLSVLEELQLEGFYHCELRPEFRSLTALASLQLQPSGNRVLQAAYTFRGRCLPPRLRTLTMSLMPPRNVIATAIAPSTTGLRSLCLESQQIVWHVSTAALDRLTSLTSLSLIGVGLKAVPPELTALSGLREVDLSGNSFWEAPSWERLLSLRLLSKLAVDGMGCPVPLPWELLCLPELKVGLGLLAAGLVAAGPLVDF
jgi:hypothetical protein